MTEKAKHYFVSAGMYIPDESDISRLAEVSADAMWEDNSSKYLLGGHINRENFRRYMQLLFKAAFDQTFFIAPDRNINGFLWVQPPPRSDIDKDHLLRAGIAGAIMHIGPDTVRRSVAYEENCASIMKKLCDLEKTWYICQFAVSREYQCGGVGSAIIRPFLRYMDMVEQPCYLETHNDGNIPMYKHLGFDLVSTNHVPDGTYEQYAMLYE